MSYYRCDRSETALPAVYLWMFVIFVGAAMIGFEGVCEGELAGSGFSIYGAPAAIGTRSKRKDFLIT